LKRAYYAVLGRLQLIFRSHLADSRGVIGFAVMHNETTVNHPSQPGAHSATARLSRSEMLRRATTEGPFDVIIVGGGATGLGAAVDAATRGYKTLLLEGSDFAKGTSSRSTKLVHGGVRYLAQGNVSLVFEALHERGLLHQNAPHLCSILPFVVPAYKWFDQPYYGAGLLLYSLLAGKRGFGFSRIIGKAEALRLAPTLQAQDLRGGVVYYDGQFDDTRLAITLMRTFVDLGGVAINYARVAGLLKQGDKVSGVGFVDMLTNDEHEVAGAGVINATGVFTDALRRMDDPTAKKTVAPSQGVHIVLDKAYLPGDHAIMIPKTDDGRVLFAVPWHGRVIVGTTDTPVPETSEEPRALEKEIAFLLSHASRYLSRPVNASNVLSIYAGLRPLVKAGDDQNTKALSRDHTIMIAPSGLVTITGGKWTTYRHMGKDVINRVAQVAGLPAAASRTESLALRGATRDPLPDPERVYGSDASAVADVCAERQEWRTPLVDGLPYRLGEAVWAARYELAQTVEDVLARRTRALLLDARASIVAAPRVAAVLAESLGHDVTWQRAQVQAFTRLAEGYLVK
jgi:glycerol-3-phosphate dehydrogenase